MPSQDSAQQNSSAPDQTSARREYQRYAATDGREHSATEEPDVLLDVPVLKVGGINLEVRGLAQRGPSVERYDAPLRAATIGRAPPPGPRLSLKEGACIVIRPRLPRKQKGIFAYLSLMFYGRLENLLS